MTLAMAHFALPLSFSDLQQMDVLNGTIGRLLLACALGAAVGLQRELHHRSAGVRTNLLISMGAAFFTLLSAVLAGENSPNKGQVAANIVQGIGFLGAGLILRNQNRVSGLASAASVWAVASIGMACGAGLYLAATVAAFIVIVSMELVGFLERRAGIRPYGVTYEARGEDQHQMLQSILKVMDQTHVRLADVQTNAIGNTQRVTFPLNATANQHKRMRTQLVTEPGISGLLSFRDPEDD
ncbi:MAG: MgtC/SapB family protein [Terracidiphilus sp.]|jgi:putative Mg2+ transporter-C (MgtC) family protein